MTEIYSPFKFNPYEIHSLEEMDEAVRQWQEWKLRQLTHTPHSVPKGYRREVFGSRQVVEKEVKH